MPGDACLTGTEWGGVAEQAARHIVKNEKMKIEFLLFIDPSVSRYFLNYRG